MKEYYKEQRNIAVTHNDWEMYRKLVWLQNKSVACKLQLAIVAGQLKKYRGY